MPLLTDPPCARQADYPGSRLAATNLNSATYLRSTEPRGPLPSLPTTLHAPATCPSTATNRTRTAPRSARRARLDRTALRPARRADLASLSWPTLPKPIPNDSSILYGLNQHATGRPALACHAVSPPPRVRLPASPAHQPAVRAGHGTTCPPDWTHLDWPSSHRDMSPLCSATCRPMTTRILTPRLSMTRRHSPPSVLTGPLRLSRPHQTSTPLGALDVTSQASPGQAPAARRDLTCHNRSPSPPPQRATHRPDKLTTPLAPAGPN